MTTAERRAEHTGCTEERVAGLWAELLGHPDPTGSDIPRDVPFLKFGGDSVLAVRLASAIRRQHGVRLGLAQVGATSTVRDLAAAIDADGAPGRTEALPVELLRRHDPQAPFGLLPLQQGYFVGQQDGWELSYRSAHFHSDLGLVDVEQDEAAEALADGLYRLAEHHPMIRARITDDGRQYVLRMIDDGAVPELVVNDLRSCTPAEVEQRLGAIRTEMGRIGPDPRTGPGVAIHLSLLPGECARLHTSISLLVFDGWSANLLTRDLLTLSADWNAVLPPLDVGFADYVDAIGELPHTDAYRADRDWWRARLPSLPPPPALPVVIDPRQANPETMRTLQAHLPAAHLQRIRAACSEYGVTPSTALYTAFAVVLARWAGHRHLLLGSLQLNRLPLHPDLHRVIGAFASTLLLTAELETGADFAALAATAQRQFTESAGRSLITGVEVSRELGRHLDSRRPMAPVVFQSTLGLDAALGDRLSDDVGPLGRIQDGEFHHQLRTPQVALEMRCYEERGQLTIVFSVVEELFEPRAVQRAFDEVLALTAHLDDPEFWTSVVQLPAAERPVDSAGPTLTPLEPLSPRNTHRPGEPDTELEQIVAQAWQDILGSPVQDRSISFFTLGGDSLAIVRVLAKLTRRTGIRVGIRDLIADPTVAGTAVALSAADSAVIR